MIPSGRKREVVTIPAEWGGRDAGKHFLITEAPAMQAEKWAWKLWIAVKGTSASIPESIAPLGMIAVAIRGINSFLAADVEFEKLEPLLDEIMTCVQIVRDPNTPDPVLPGVPLATKLMTDDIQEPRTITWLRGEVVRVHTNFSFIDAMTAWMTMVADLKATWDSATSSSTT